MTRYLLALAFALLLGFNGWGCASPPEPFGVKPLVLSPVTELSDATELWATEWSLGTGIPISVRAGGTPVVLEEDLKDGACANTELRSPKGQPELFEVIKIRVDPTPPGGCPSSLESNIGHEIGHALAGPRVPHSGDGVFSSPMVSSELTEDSIAAVCVRASCAL